MFYAELASMQREIVSDIKDLLKEIKAYRNDMVARNYPFQEISNIITKWEMKITTNETMKPVNSPMSEE
jgi:hypothetical protein